ncbi:MAG: hypothetical protein JXB05_28910 [Myxococcaceae bacterium]|nr:hypothetical protein [Myxococcaceae bacterium]
MRSTRILPLLCAGVFAGACATSGELRDLRIFNERPPRPAGCEFEVFEQREPPRDYELIGTLALTGNQWLGEKGRKELLSETVCQAGADAVILSHPMERKGAAGRLREFEAQFISYELRSGEPAALPELPPAEPGAITAPRGMEWPEESVGEAVRTWEPRKGESSSE